MSHPTELSKSAHVQVVPLVDLSGSYDVRRAAFAAPPAAPWVSCRVTLTRRHVAFAVTRLGPDRESFDLELADIQAVELAPGRIPRVITLRTADRLVHVRTSGAAALAKRIAISREAAQRVSR